MSIVKPPETGAFFKPPREFPEAHPQAASLSGLGNGSGATRENRHLAKQKINRCEIRIEGICVDAIMLTWAHSQKTRFLTTSKDWQEAARCCLPCHQHIEALPHHKMCAIILAAIHRRKPQS